VRDGDEARWCRMVLVEAEFIAVLALRIGAAGRQPNPACLRIADVETRERDVLFRDYLHMLRELRVRQIAWRGKVEGVDREFGNFGVEDVEHEVDGPMVRRTSNGRAPRTGTRPNRPYQSRAVAA
jgi:hypothetical protein